MSPIEPDRALMASVLDRLLDDDPDTRAEPLKSNRIQIRELRNAVRRDLENLLNTRQLILQWPEEMTEIEHSVLNYGVPDPTGANLSSKRSREAYLRSLEIVIRHFEPRFKSVKIVPTESSDPLDRILRFRIEALLHAEPAPEMVAFDSLLEPVSRSIEVSPRES